VDNSKKRSAGRADVLTGPAGPAGLAGLAGLAGSTGAAESGALLILRDLG
jgi:hypothetical protein